MPGKLITWNGNPSNAVSDLIIGEITRSVIGRPRTRFMEVAGKEGVWFFPNKRGTRIITANMAVSSSVADFEESMELVSDWLDVEGVGKLILGSSPDRFYQGVLRDVTDPVEWRGLARFQATWEVEPYSFDVNLSTEDWTASSGTNHIWNADLLVPSYPIVEITPLNGTLEEFVIACNGYVTGVSDLTMVTSEVVTINSLIPAVLTGPNDDVELTGSYDPNDVELYGVVGEFPILVPGAGNQLQFTKLAGTATSFLIEVTYRKRFRR